MANGARKDNNNFGAKLHWIINERTIIKDGKKIVLHWEAHTNIVLHDSQSVWNQVVSLNLVCWTFVFSWCPSRNITTSSHYWFCWVFIFNHCHKRSWCLTYLFFCFFCVCFSSFVCHFLFGFMVLWLKFSFGRYLSFWNIFRWCLRSTKLWLIQKKTFVFNTEFFLHLLSWKLMYRREIYRAERTRNDIFFRFIGIHCCCRCFCAFLVEIHEIFSSCSLMFEHASSY